MRRSPRPRSLAAALLLALLPLGACSEGTTGPEDRKNAELPTPFVVSGTLQNRTGVPVPASARVVVSWWRFETADEHSYVWGEGTVNPADGTFRIVLDAAPPAAVVNFGRMGIAHVYLTTDPNVKTGSRITDLPRSSILGAAGEYAILFVADDPAKIGDWVGQFPRGYSVGKGVKRPGNPFDAFQPVDAGSVELTVDDLKNIRFTNWS